MLLRSVSLFLLFIMIGSTSSSQLKTNVKRKGWEPGNIIKITSGSTYSLKQLSGKWQETARTDRYNDSAITFKDSLYLHFSGDDVFTRDGVSMSMRGKASLERGNSLMAAADLYIIKSISKNEAVLDDGDKYIHRFTRKETFWYETLPNTMVVIEKYDTARIIDLSSLPGKWRVYRRDAKPGSLASSDYLIQMLKITIRDVYSATGEITFYSGENLETLPCSITIEGNEINIISEKYTWLMNTYKADGAEFIFGDSELMYFSKPV